MPNYIATKQIASPFGSFPPNSRIQNVPEKVLTVWLRKGDIEPSTRFDDEEEEALGEIDDELVPMSRDQLKHLIKDENLGVRVFVNTPDSKIRELIREARSNKKKEVSSVDE